MGCGASSTAAEPVLTNTNPAISSRALSRRVATPDRPYYVSALSFSPQQGYRITGTSRYAVNTDDQPKADASLLASAQASARAKTSPSPWRGANVELVGDSDAPLRFTRAELETIGGFICRFCNGKSCKHEDWTLQKGYPDTCAIRGLNSTWITTKIIAMQRPSTRLVEEYHVIDQLLAAGVRAIFNLQLPGEHAHCGDGIHKDGDGFSYRLEEFQRRGISTYNLSWVDMGVPTSSFMLNIVQLMDYHLSVRGEAVAVHCHAGYGRTGLAIAAWLMYARGGRPDAVITAVRSRRPPCIQTSKQVAFLHEFEAFLSSLRQVFHPDSTSLLKLRSLLANVILRTKDQSHLNSPASSKSKGQYSSQAERNDKPSDDVRPKHSPLRILCHGPHHEAPTPHNSVQSPPGLVSVVSTTALSKTQENPRRASLGSLQLTALREKSMQTRPDWGLETTPTPEKPSRVHTQAALSRSQPASHPLAHTTPSLFTKPIDLFAISEPSYASPLKLPSTLTPLTVPEEEEHDNEAQSQGRQGDEPIDAKDETSARPQVPASIAALLASPMHRSLSVSLSLNQRGTTTSSGSSIISARGALTPTARTSLVLAAGTPGPSEIPSPLILPKPAASVAERQSKSTMINASDPAPVLTSLLKKQQTLLHGREAMELRYTHKILVACVDCAFACLNPHIIPFARLGQFLPDPGVAGGVFSVAVVPQRRNKGSVPHNRTEEQKSAPLDVDPEQGLLSQYIHRNYDKQNILSSVIYKTPRHQANPAVSNVNAESALVDLARSPPGAEIAVESWLFELAFGVPIRAMQTKASTSVGSDSPIPWDDVSDPMDLLQAHPAFNRSASLRVAIQALTKLSQTPALEDAVDSPVPEVQEVSSARTNIRSRTFSVDHPSAGGVHVSASPLRRPMPNSIRTRNPSRALPASPSMRLRSHTRSRSRTRTGSALPHDDEWHDSLPALPLAKTHPVDTDDSSYEAKSVSGAGNRKREGKQAQHASPVLASDLSGTLNTPSDPLTPSFDTELSTACSVGHRHMPQHSRQGKPGHLRSPSSKTLSKAPPSPPISARQAPKLPPKVDKGRFQSRPSFALSTASASSLSHVGPTSSPKVQTIPWPPPAVGKWSMATEAYVAFLKERLNRGDYSVLRSVLMHEAQLLQRVDAAPNDNNRLQLSGFTYIMVLVFDFLDTIPTPFVSLTNIGRLSSMDLPTPSTPRQSNEIIELAQRTKDWWNAHLVPNSALTAQLPWWRPFVLMQGADLVSESQTQAADASTRLVDIVDLVDDHPHIWATLAQVARLVSLICYPLGRDSTVPDLATSSGDLSEAKVSVGADYGKEDQARSLGLPLTSEMVRARLSQPSAEEKIRCIVSGILFSLEIPDDVSMQRPASTLSSYSSVAKARLRLLLRLGYSLFRHPLLHSSASPNAETVYCAAIEGVLSDPLIVQQLMSHDQSSATLPQTQVPRRGSISLCDSTIAVIERSLLGATAGVPESPLTPRDPVSWMPGEGHIRRNSSTSSFSSHILSHIAQQARINARLAALVAPTAPEQVVAAWIVFWLVQLSVALAPDGIITVAPIA